MEMSWSTFTQSREISGRCRNEGRGQTRASWATQGGLKVSELSLRTQQPKDDSRYGKS